MASLENRTGYYNIIFYFGGQRFVRSLKTKDEEEAEARRKRLEENMRLVESGRIEIPDGADAATFLLSDGKLTSKPVAEPTLTLSHLFSQFFATLDGNLEDSTLYGMRLHCRHLERVLGARFPVQNLQRSDLQRYVNQRQDEKAGKGTVGRNTINKELVTFSSAWKWAAVEGNVAGPFPRQGIKLQKAKETPPFQTWGEIERQTDDPESELWDSLYLTMAEIEELLEDVKSCAAFPFIHPMFCFAAYTGGRRSELLRSQVPDIDFANKTVTIREKKRVRGQLTTRRLPLSRPLAKVLRPWLKNHPGGPTFCHLQKVIERSGKTMDRENGPIPLTGHEAHHYIKHTLKDSKWEVIPGWHCLRHSFISNCASKGIDQRMIDEWVGHSTEAMRRRYRHLFPSSQQEAMKQLFR